MWMNLAGKSSQEVRAASPPAKEKQKVYLVRVKGCMIVPCEHKLVSAALHRLEGMR